MAMTKYEMEKFTWKNEFGLWRIKMRVMLTRQGLSDALKRCKLFGEGVDELRRAEMLEKDHNMIVLCLGDKAIGMLNALLRLYEHLRDAMLYEGEATITLD